jgi:hypothetical protein
MLVQCVLAMSFFSMKMSDATVKGHNNSGAETKFSQLQETTIGTQSL